MNGPFGYKSSSHVREALGQLEQPVAIDVFKELIEVAFFCHPFG